MFQRRELESSQGSVTGSVSSKAGMDRENFSISRALLMGGTVALATFGTLEAWILFPAVVHHLDGPSIHEVLNHMRADYIRQLPDVTKAVGGLSVAIGVLAAADYREIDAVSVSS